MLGKKTCDQEDTSGPSLTVNAGLHLEHVLRAPTAVVVLCTDVETVDRFRHEAVDVKRCLVVRHNRVFLWIDHCLFDAVTVSVSLYALVDDLSQTGVNVKTK